MRLTLSTAPARDLPTLVFLVGAFECAALYLIFAKISAIGGILVALIGVSFVFLLKESLPVTNRALVIDDNGVFDRRLGVGMIRWADIKSVKIELGYNHGYLCLELNSPESYLQRLSGIKRRRVMEYRHLGFHSFNVDVRGLNVSLLDLKKIFEKHMAKHKLRAHHAFVIRS